MPSNIHMLNSLEEVVVVKETHVQAFQIIADAISNDKPLFTLHNLDGEEVSLPTHKFSRLKKR